MSKVYVMHCLLFFPHSLSPCAAQSPLTCLVGRLQKPMQEAANRWAPEGSAHRAEPRKKQRYESSVSKHDYLVPRAGYYFEVICHASHNRMASLLLPMHDHDQTTLARMLWCSTTTETMRAPPKATVICQVYFCALALGSNPRDHSPVAPSSLASFCCAPRAGRGNGDFRGQLHTRRGQDSRPHDWYGDRSSSGGCPALCTVLQM